MSQEFDPYYKWLGIPTKEQPPNHYRLLSISLFEDDLDVIQEAADRQMSHLQTHKAGKYSDHSQRLLNEIAAAKVCLLKPERKQEYDEKLRAEQSSLSAPPLKAKAPPKARPKVRTAQPVQAQPIAQVYEPGAEFSFEGASPSASQQYINQRKSGAPMYIGIGAAVVIILGLGIVFGLSGGGPEPSPNGNQQANSGNTGNNTNPNSGNPDTNSNTGTNPGNSNTNPNNNNPGTRPGTRPNNGNGRPRPPIGPGNQRPNQNRAKKSLDFGSLAFSSAALSADRNVAILGGKEGKIAVFDTNSERVLNTFTINSRPISALDENNGIVAAGSDNEKVILFDLKNGSQLKSLLGLTGSCRSVAFHPNGQSLFATSTKHLIGWEIDTGKVILNKKLDGSVRTSYQNVAVHPAGFIVVGYNQDRGVELFQLTSDEPRLIAILPMERTSKIAISNDQLRLMAYSFRELKIWNLGKSPSLARIIKPERSKNIMSACFSPNSRFILTSGQNSLDLIDVDSGKVVKATEAPYYFFTSTPTNSNKIMLAMPQVGNRSSSGVLLNWDSFYPEGRALRPNTSPAIEKALAKDSFEVKLDNGTELNFVGIPPGEIDLSFSGKVRHASFERSYLMMNTEVTIGLWNKVMEGSEWVRPNSNPELPVTNVSYDEAIFFASKMSELSSQMNFRLPTASEFEYARKAGLPSENFFGSNLLKFNSFSWTEENSSGKLQSVAQKPKSPWNLYDMNGNVREWVLDSWDQTTEFRSSNPVGSITLPSAKAMGGAYSDPITRQNHPIHIASHSTARPDIGFRLVAESTFSTSPYPKVLVKSDLRPRTPGQVPPDGGTSPGTQPGNGNLGDIVNNPPKPEPIERIPVPSESEQEEAKRNIREAYGDEFTNARTPEQKSILASKLLAESAQSKDSPGDYYMMLMEAYELSKSAGQFRISWPCLDKIAEKFERTVLKEKEISLNASIRNAKTASDLRLVTESWLTLVDDAIEQKEYALLTKFSASAVKTSRRVKGDTLLIRQAESANKKAKEIFGAFTKAMTARDALELDSSDKEASSTWGQFLCIYQDNWKDGLPIISDGISGEWKDAADLDQTGAQDGPGQMAIGDAWWKIADSIENSAHSVEVLRKRAVVWYELSLPQISGITQTKIKNRIKSVHELSSDLPIGEWINVIPIINAQRDAYKGKWAVSNEGLYTVKNGGSASYTFGGEYGTSALKIPINIEGSYELRMKFQRIQGGYSSIYGTVIQIGFGPERQTRFVVNPYGSGREARLELSGTYSNNQPGQIYSSSAPYLSYGALNGIELKVEDEGEDVHIRAALNSNPVVDWKGPKTHLNSTATYGNYWNLPQGTGIGVGTRRGGIAISLLEIRVTSGKASLVK